MRVGVTFENSEDPRLLDVVAQMPTSTLVRLINQPHSNLAKLREIIKALKAHQPGVPVLLCVVDSSRVEDLSEVAYLNEFERCFEELNDVLGPEDRWEAGNEIGGGSSDPLHMEKALSAMRWFLAKGTTIKGELALTGYAVRDYLTYLEKLPAQMRSAVELFLMSDYQLDGCLKPEVIDWVALHELFPNALLGIGECGIPMLGDDVPDGTRAYEQHRVESLMDEFAKLRAPHVPEFEIPLMWWYGSQQFISRKMSSSTTPLLRRFITIADDLAAKAEAELKRSEGAPHVGVDEGTADQTVETFQFGEHQILVIEKTADGPSSTSALLLFNKETGDVELWQNGSRLYWSSPKLPNFQAWADWIETTYGKALSEGVPVQCMSLPVEAAPTGFYPEPQSSPPPNPTAIEVQEKAEEKKPAKKSRAKQK